MNGTEMIIFHLQVIMSPTPTSCTETQYKQDLRTYVHVPNYVHVYAL